jgi:hypothetical protein
VRGWLEVQSTESQLTSVSDNQVTPGDPTIHPVRWEARLRPHCARLPSDVGHLSSQPDAAVAQVCATC